MVAGIDLNEGVLVVDVPPIDAPNATTEKVKPMEAQQILKEIDATVLLQQELMRSDPLLASASSFLSVVCGGERKSTDDKNISEANVKMARPAKRVPPTIDRPPMSARCVEKQRVIRITVSESLLKEELAKDNLSLASIAAFRKAAYGDENSSSADQDRTNRGNRDITWCGDRPGQQTDRGIYIPDFSVGTVGG